MDIYTLFNASSVLDENPNYAAFRRPTAILIRRFIRSARSSIFDGPAGSQLPTPNFQLPTSNSQLPTPNSQEIFWGVGNWELGVLLR